MAPVPPTPNLQPDLQILGQYRGYTLEIRLAPSNAATPDGSPPPDWAIAVQQAQAKLDRHIEYSRIAGQFETQFLAPLIEQGFSKSKILDAIADFANRSQWPEEVVKSLEYAAAALQDEDPITGQPANPSVSQKPLPPPHANPT